MRALALALALSALPLAAVAEPVAPPPPDGGCVGEDCAPPPTTTPVVPTGTPQELECWLTDKIIVVLDTPTLCGVRLGVFVIDVELG